MSTLSHYPSLIGFLDERFERLEQLTRIVVASCLFGRDRWMALHNHEATVGGVRRRRRLQAVDELLNRIGGAAVLVYADIPSTLLARGETDGTTDIPQMSRIDNVWSHVTLSAVFAAISWLQRSGVSFGTIDLYYDRKDLTNAHRSRFENVLRQVLPETAKKAVERDPSLFTADPSKLCLGTISGVGKPEPASSSNAFQHGTSLADHLCAQAATIIGRGSHGRTLVRDHTAVVCDLICKFRLTG